MKGAVVLQHREPNRSSVEHYRRLNKTSHIYKSIEVLDAVKHSKAHWLEIVATHFHGKVVSVAEVWLSSVECSKTYICPWNKSIHMTELIY